MNACTNPDAGGPNTPPWSPFISLPLKLISYATDMGKLSEIALSFWLLVGASPTIQASSFTTDGFACVRIYLPNKIVLICFWKTRLSLMLG